MFLILFISSNIIGHAGWHCPGISYSEREPEVPTALHDCLFSSVKVSQIPPCTYVDLLECSEFLRFPTSFNKPVCVEKSFSVPKGAL